MIKYVGLFFDKKETNLIKSLETNNLGNQNDLLHCTFKYRPDDNGFFDEIMGKTFEIYLIGYGNDGNNSGFEVSLPKELVKYYINYDEEKTDVLKVPHITVSLSKDAKGVNTKNLKFVPLEKSVKVMGTFGCWVKENNQEFLSFEPLDKFKDIYVDIESYK